MTDWTCSICLESNKDNVITLEPCGHTFHANCIVTALRINGVKCPYCRGIDNRCTETKSLNQNQTENDNFSLEDLNEIHELLSDDNLENQNNSNFIDSIFSDTNISSISLTWNDDFNMTDEEENFLINNLDGVINQTENYESKCN